jgi:hypothetical protein
MLSLRQVCRCLDVRRPGDDPFRFGQRLRELGQQNVTLEQVLERRQ